MQQPPQPYEVPLPEVVRVTPIPNEMIKLIPLFGGDKRLLNLFLRKCEYVIDRYRGHEEQNIYILHTITSRLIDNAAALLLERDDISTWSALKQLLEQHFGDPRSEECINIELESCKIKLGESYLDFCNRIQNIRSLLISKANLASEPDMKRAKITIYNNTALNVFLYNLPENMVRVVRLKAPSTLEQALSIVLEEVNFHEQYTLRNRMHSNQSAPKPSFNTTGPVGFKFGNSQPTLQFGYKPALQSFTPQPKFNFGIPHNRPHLGQHQSTSVRPQFGYRPPQFGYRPQMQTQQPFGYKPPQFQNNTQQFSYKPTQNLGMTPQQFGYRPPQGFRMTPQQFGYRPPQVQAPRFQESDVTIN